MRRLFLPVLCLLAALIPADGEPRTLRMAVFPVEPFMMLDPATGDVSGAVVDYWKEYIAPKMGASVEVAGNFPSNRVMVMLEKGEIDIAPLFTKIPEREALFLFPETPFDEAIGCLMVRPESPIREVKRQEDLHGLRVGYLEKAYLPAFMLHPSILIDFVSGADYREINLKKLLAGRIDAWFDINYISVRYYLKYVKHLDKVKIIMLPTERPKLYSIFRKTPEGARLRDEYDRINREGMRTGVYRKILARYLD